MQLDDVLTELVTDSGDRLLRVAYQLTHDRGTAQPPAACSGRLQNIGRLGEDKALVPAGVTSLTICTPKAHTVTSGYQVLVRALNRLPTHASIGYCSGAIGSGAYYRLLFSYAKGPMASVDIIVGCHPEVENTDLQSASASTVMPIIQQLLKANSGIVPLRGYDFG